MKVLHIIPSAFDYFNDIRAEAFSLMESLRKLGVETEAFTLQYHTTTAPRAEREAKEEARSSGSASGRQFISMAGIAEVIESIDSFDALHLHCPLFGAAGKIIKWKSAHPRIPLIITYYRRVKPVDLFSLFILWYNAYYLPRLFRAAEAVAAESLADFKTNGGASYLFRGRSAIEISQAGKYAALYEQLIGVS